MEFHFLMEQLQSGRNDVKVQLIHALRKITSNFPSKITEMYLYIRSFVLMGPDSDSSKEFLKFCKNLITGNNSYLIPVVQMTVANLVPRTNQFSFYSENDEYDPATTDAIIQQITNFIKEILLLIPLSIGIIGKKLQRGFPHYRRSIYHLEVYLKALLICCDFSSALKQIILPALVNDISKIDMAIVSDINDESDNNSTNSEDASSVMSDTLTSMMFTMELGDGDNSEEGVQKRNKILMSKIDVLLSTLFKFLLCFYFKIDILTGL